MYLKKVFWQEKEFLPEKFLLLYRLTILVKNRKTIVLARVYKPKHLTKDYYAYLFFCLMVFLFIGKNTMLAQQLSSFVEYGAALHTGDNTPLWQVSNQQGLTSLDNNTYIRGGISYKHQLGKWKFEEALDLVAAAGFSTTSFIVQQAYVDIRYKWFGFFAGSREQNSPLLNQELSSGGMTWSGNARPIPQVQIGIPRVCTVATPV